MRTISFFSLIMLLKSEMRKKSHRNVVFMSLVTLFTSAIGRRRVRTERRHTQMRSNRKRNADHTGQFYSSGKWSTSITIWFALIWVQCKSFILQIVTSVDWSFCWMWIVIVDMIMIEILSCISVWFALLGAFVLRYSRHVQLTVCEIYIVRFFICSV